jgi:hypothetical protein
VVGTGTYSVTATSNPNVGTIVFGSNTSSVCTVNSSTGELTILTSGTCTITADNSGDSNHAAASQDLQSFSIAPAASSNNNSNSAPAPEPTPVAPARPVVPAVPEAVTPAEPVIKATDGTSVTANYSNTMTLIDGVMKEEKITVIDTTKVVTEAQGIKLELKVLTQEFKAVSVTNEVQLTLQHTGIAEFAGTGFKSKTTVKVWLFSDPIYLGEYPVDASGTFNATFLVLEQLPVGNHLLQINGVTGDSKVFSQSIPVVVKGIDASVPVKPVDPTTPVEEKPITPTVPSTKNPLVSIYFKNTSAKIDGVIIGNFKKYASKIKGAKSITCIAYKVSNKYADKLLRARATNVCNYLKRNFGGVAKIAVLPISKASTKSNFNSKTRNGRVDIFVVR